MVNLTAMWKAVGGTEGQKPKHWADKHWAELPPTKTFLKTLAKKQKVGLSDLIQVTRGRFGGTKAHRQAALEYAKYLDPNLAILVNEVFFERVEEETNPDLAFERGTDRFIKGYRKKGKEDAWIQARLEGKLTRRRFTSALGQNGCNLANQLGKFTNIVNLNVLGQTSDELKQPRGVKTVRNGLNTLELCPLGLRALALRPPISTMHRHSSSTTFYGLGVSGPNGGYSKLAEGYVLSVHVASSSTVELARHFRVLDSL